MQTMLMGFSLGLKLVHRFLSALLKAVSLNSRQFLQYHRVTVLFLYIGFPFQKFFNKVGNSFEIFIKGLVDC